MTTKTNMGVEHLEVYKKLCPLHIEVILKQTRMQRWKGSPSYRILKLKLPVFGLVVILATAIGAIFAPWLAPCPANGAAFATGSPGALHKVCPSCNHSPA